MVRLRSGMWMINLPSAVRWPNLPEHVRWFAAHYRRFWPNAALSLLLSAVRAVLLLLPPWLTKVLVDRVLPAGDGRQLVLYALALVVIPVVTGFMILWDLWLCRLALRLTADIRTQLYDGIQRRPLDRLQATPVGDLLSRLQDDTEQAGQFMYTGTAAFGWFTTTIVAGIAMMLALDPALAGVALLSLGLQLFVTTRLGGSAGRAAKEMAQHQAELYERVRESIDGIEHIKSSVLEDVELQRLEAIFERYAQQQAQQTWIDWKARLNHAVARGVTPAVLYGVGGLLVLRDATTIGAVVAAIGIYHWIHPAVLDYQRIVLRGRRVSPLMQRLHEIAYAADEPAGSLIPASALDLELANVTYAHAAAAERCLSGAAAVLPAGGTVGLTGRSGSGKSTIAELVSALRKPLSGNILLGGVDVQEIDRSWLTSHVQLVPQEGLLRSGSIEENVRLGLVADAPCEVEHLLDLVGLRDLIARLPDGADTQIGDKGMRLSGGERQRVALARALARRPSILVLDESTAALDSVNERLVMERVRSFLPKATLIIISHRSSALASAQRVYQLEDGLLRCACVE